MPGQLSSQKAAISRTTFVLIFSSMELKLFNITDILQFIKLYACSF